MSVAAVEILQSRPLLLAGVQPKGGHKYLQGGCRTLGLGILTETLEEVSIRSSIFPLT